MELQKFCEVELGDEFLIDGNAYRKISVELAILVRLPHGNPPSNKDIRMFNARTLVVGRSLLTD